MGKQYFDPKLKIFSLSSNRPLAEKIAAAVGVELGKCSVSKFSDGEIQINIEESIRGSHVSIIQSTNAPADHLMELLIMIDALNRASAETINVVIPYYGYARQDRKAFSREPITSKLIANLLERAGATRILTLDLHEVQLQGFFDIPVDHLMSFPLFSQCLIGHGLSGENVVVVSPNQGNVSRARKLARALDTSIAIVDNRSSSEGDQSDMTIIGTVKDKRCVLIDDIVNTAETLAFGAKALENAGASEIYACATHSLITDDGIRMLEDSAIKTLMVTDSVWIPEEKQFDLLEIVSVSNLMAEAIKYIHEDKPVSPLFDDHPVK